MVKIILENSHIFYSLLKQEQPSVNITIAFKVTMIQLVICDMIYDENEENCVSIGDLNDDHDDIL